MRSEDGINPSSSPKRASVEWGAARLREICERWFEGAVQATCLYGEFDQNFRVDAADGQRFVLKIMRDASEETGSLVGLQIAMLNHLAARNLEFLSPRPVPTRAGEDHVVIFDAAGCARIAWVLTYLEGDLLADQKVYGKEILRGLGRAVAVIDRALMDFSDPRAARYVMWNLIEAPSASRFADFVESTEQRSFLETLFLRFEGHVLPLLRKRPSSVIHNDGGNQHNMILAPGSTGEPAICGLIDFGDAVKTHTICGLGITAAYAAFGCSDVTGAIARVSSGYHEVMPLEDEDIELIPWLAATRLAMSVSIAAQRAAEDADNAYAAVSAGPAWQVLERLRGQDLPRMAEDTRRFVHDNEQ